jgi:thermitase
MRGIKEILLSFTIGFAGLFSFTYLQNENAGQIRRQEQPPPTQLAGQNEDPALALSWGLDQIGAPAAWKRETGNRQIIVAIIDTGADVFHPALKRNIWRNPGESGLDVDGMNKAMNGLDDDGNGFVDDIHGWNFVEQSPDVTDDHGHGTHIAGIVGGQGTGVARDVSLMILKYYDTQSQGIDNLTNTIAAIRYAIRMGANVINYSGGGMLHSREEEDMIKWASSLGVVMIAAAGNQGADSDVLPFYPAGYELDNILSVGATDRHGHLLSLSNHGTRSVDLAAPGKNIYSTLPNGEYGYMTGTSQATAFVSGVAALLLAHAPHLSANPPLLIRHLTQSGRNLAALKNKTRSGSLVDVSQALFSSDTELAALPQRRSPARN